MSEELRAILNDDGVFEEYDDTYDLIIHCENEEDQEEILNRLNRHWIPVKDRMPEFNDIVLASTVSDYDELRVIITVYKAEEFWFNGKIKAWMPIPKPYKEEEE